MTGDSNSHGQLVASAIRRLAGGHSGRGRDYPRLLHGFVNPEAVGAALLL